MLPDVAAAKLFVQCVLHGGRVWLKLVMQSGDASIAKSDLCS